MEDELSLLKLEKQLYQEKLAMIADISHNVAPLEVTHQVSLALGRAW